MVSERADIKRDFNFGFVIGVVIFVIFFLSYFMLTAGRGIEDKSFTDKMNIYLVMGGGGFAYIIFVLVWNNATHKRRLRLIVHEPEEAFPVFGRLKAFANPLLLFLGTFIVFGLPLFFLAKFSNTFFSGIPFKAQQITHVASVWGAAVFPAIAENLLIFIPLSLVYTWNYRKNWLRSKGLFFTINLTVIPLLFSFGWYLFHTQVYGSNEVALVSTFLFGLVGVFLTMVSMSIIPWAVVHFLTNFMLALKENGLLSSDALLVYVVVVEVGLIGVYWVVSALDKKRYGVRV